ncbi:hypothetical protein [Ureibacillus sp. GCM10028918]
MNKVKVIDIVHLGPHDVGQSAFATRDGVLWQPSLLSSCER